MKVQRGNMPRIKKSEKVPKEMHEIGTQDGSVTTRLLRSDLFELPVIADMRLVA